MRNKTLYKAKRKAVSLLLTVAIIVGFFMDVYLTHPVVAAEDATGILENVVVNVKQDGKTLSESDRLNPVKHIFFEMNFDAPVKGDVPEPKNFVKGGDTVTFELPSNLELETTTDNAIKLYFGSNTEANRVGDLTFSGRQAIVTFSNLVDDPGISDVKVSFEVEMSYDLSGIGGAPGDYDIKIQGKTYTLTVPERDISLNVNKTGIIIGKNVRWQTQVTAQYDDNNDPASLAGYVFGDDLSDDNHFASYVGGSFRVGTTDVYDDASVPGAGLAYDVGTEKLTYTFQSGDSGTRYLFFETVIPDSKLYASSNQTIANTAIVTNTENQDKDSSASVTYAPNWIDKAVTSHYSNGSSPYNPGGRQITWTITANKNNIPLKNAVITDDVTGKGLTWVSATYKKYDKDGNITTSPAITFTMEPTDKKYNLGDIDAKVELVIVTAIDDSSDPKGITNYDNTAAMTWDGLGTSVSDSAIAGVGFNPIDKSAGNYDNANHRQSWALSLDTRRLTYGGNLRILDLLVYDDNSFNPDDITTITNNTAGDFSDVTIGEIRDLTPSYSQKFVENSITTSAGLEVTVHQLKDASGDAFAEVMVITGAGGTAIDPNSSHSIAFDTLVLNPNIYAVNDTDNGTDLWNTASLFSGSSNVISDTATKNIASYMLKKDMLTRSNATAYEADTTQLSSLNGNAANDVGGYNYKDNDAFFRIHVNANGLKDAVGDVTTVVGQTLGNITVTDQLPEGWAFKPIDNTHDFLLYEGQLKSGSQDTLDAVTLVANPSTVLVAGSGIPVAPSGSNGGKVTFEFKDLTRPYMMVVKAGPLSGTIDGYFDSNKETTATNTATMTNRLNTAGFREEEAVKVVSQVIDKTSDISSADAGAYLTWEVLYNPYNRTRTGAYIEDTLPVGLDLRTDASGNLIYTDNIKVTELSLKDDGGTSDVATVAIGGGNIIRYNPNTRVLRFNIPDVSKAYKLTYVTDITGKPGAVTNSVKLYSFKDGGNADSQAYTISKLNYDTSFTRSGWVKIRKQNAQGSPLAGVDFTLYALDGTTVIRRATTDSKGEAYLKIIPEGRYILKETQSLSGYLATDETYDVTVVKNSGSYVTTVDGGTNELTVTNHAKGTTGNLVIEKSVAGNGGNQSKNFEFTVTFGGASGTYQYFGTGVSDGTIKSGDTVGLSHGKAIKIVGLPKDATYTVTETDYSSEGYVTAQSGQTGTIIVDSTVTAAFTNTREVGNLIVQKAVAGNGADVNKAFDFTLTLTGTALSYSYKGTGVADGTITSGDTIALAHGQSIEIMDLPAGTAYTVAEADYSSEGYTTTATGETGTISTSQKAQAAFTNSREVGDLIIRKNVTGNLADYKKAFAFTVTFSDETTVYNYLGTGVDDGTIKSGDTIHLADGQSIHIQNILKDTTYKVVEANYAPEGYSTTFTGDTGTIVSGQAAKAVFYNDASASYSNTVTTTAAPETTAVPTTTPPKTTTHKTKAPFFVKETTPPSSPEPTAATATTYPETIVYRPSDDVTEVVVKEGPENGTIDIIDDEILYAPGFNFDGKDRVVVVVTTRDGDEVEVIIDIEEIGEGTLPRTGGLSANIIIAIGLIFIAAGLGLRKKWFVDVDKQ